MTDQKIKDLEEEIAFLKHEADQRAYERPAFLGEIELKEENEVLKNKIKTLEARRTKLNILYEDKIPNGTKFVALYSDGSGADLFYTNEIGELFNSDSELIDIKDHSWLEDAGYLWWIELPQEFEIWREDFEKWGKK